MNCFKQTRLKVSSAVCIILAMLLTVFAYGIKPSRTVMADSDLQVPSTVTAFTQEEPARMYPYNGTYREPVQWFSFTPESSGLYRINLGGVTMSETISVYDSSMKLLGIGPLYVSLPMAEDETYYIRIEEFEADAYGPYKYIEISVKDADYAVYAEKGDTGLFMQSLDGDFCVAKGEKIFFRVVLNVDLNCKWYKYDNGPITWINPDPTVDDPEKPRTSPSLTVSCPAAEAEYKLIICDEKDEAVETEDIYVHNKDLLVIDGKTFSYKPVMVGYNKAYGFEGDVYNTYSSSPASTDITRYSTSDYYSSSNTAILFISGVTDFSILKLHAKYSSWEACKLEFLFVDDPSTNETLTLGTPKNICIENEFNQYVYEQRVLEFTPPVDATYTFRSFNRQCGNPEVALFDENYDIIDYSMPCMDDLWIPNTLGHHTLTDDLDYVASGRYLNPNFRWNEKQYMSTPDVTLTADLKAGQKYYFAIPYYDTSSSNFDVEITTDATVPTATATPVPTNPATATPVPTTRPDSASPTVTPTSAAVPSGSSGRPSVTPVSKVSDAPTVTPVVTTKPDTTITPTVTDTPSADPKAQILEFVERIYIYVLDREPEREGAAFWSDELYSFRRTGAEVAQGFIFSDEFVNRNTSDTEFVTILYKTFFGREPEEEGLNFWLSQLSSGTMDRVTVANGFIYSQEWADTCASYGIRSGGELKPTGKIEPTSLTYAFVERMYTTAMGRGYDEEGRQYWASELANFNLTGEQCGAAFFLSDEMNGYNLSDKEFLGRLYATFMNREPDVDGEAYWLSQMSAGVSRADIVFGFTRSPEFTEKCVEARILPY